MPVSVSEGLPPDNHVHPNVIGNNRCNYRYNNNNHKPKSPGGQLQLQIFQTNGLSAINIQRYIKIIKQISVALEKVKLQTSVAIVSNVDMLFMI